MDLSNYLVTISGINATDTPIAEKIPATVINEASTSGEVGNDGG